MAFAVAGEAPVTQGGIAAELARVDSRMSQLSLSHEVMRRTLSHKASLANSVPLGAIPEIHQPSSATRESDAESRDDVPGVEVRNDCRSPLCKGQYHSSCMYPST